MLVFEEGKKNEQAWSAAMKVAVSLLGIFKQFHRRLH